MEFSIELLRNSSPEKLKEYAWYVQLYGNLLDKVIMQLLLDWPLVLALLAIAAFATWLVINGR